MDDLWKAIAELTARVHGDRIVSIAEAIGQLASIGEFEKARHAFGPAAEKREVELVKRAWSGAPDVSPGEVASAFMAAREMARLSERVSVAELVWTGPRTGLIPTRHTEQVILEVIDSARSDVFLVSYVFLKASSVVASLNEAVRRGVNADVLLESSTEHGGSVRVDGVKAMREAVPGATIYIWDIASKNPDAGSLSASVHAKCVVADGNLAFITSANLTSAALERNMELGVLVRGGGIPKALRSHLEALVATKVIKPWEG
jgi:cardiolipin synthase A/B